MRRLVAAAVLAVGVLPAGGASAHGTTDPRRAPVVDRIDPPLPAAVVVQLRTSVEPELVVDNPTATELAVLDTEGQPFIRVSRAGVYGDTASAYWYPSLSPSASIVPIPGPRAAVWKLMSRGTSWGWFDHRLHPPRETVWQLTLRYGRTDYNVHGRIVMQPLGSYVPKFDGATPDGVTVQLLPGKVPGLFLQAKSDTPVIVYGGSGEPFARLTAGKAEFNVLSPTYLADRRFRGSVPPGVLADAAAPPRWHAEGESVTWLDERLSFPPGSPPPAKRASVHWRLPLEVSGRRTELVGSTTWTPLVDLVPSAPKRSPFERFLPAILLAGVLAIFAAAEAIRRRLGTD